MEIVRKTEVSIFDHESDGHIVITPLSEATRQRIYKIQKRISDTLPLGSLWLPRGEQLHITFAHLISPDSIYEEDKIDLWSKLEPAADQSLEKITRHPKIDIKLQQIEAFPSTIIIKWKDDGSFENLRNMFTNLVKLP